MKKSEISSEIALIAAQIINSFADNKIGWIRFEKAEWIFEELHSMDKVLERNFGASFDYQNTDSYEIKIIFRGKDIQMMEQVKGAIDYMLNQNGSFRHEWMEIAKEQKSKK